MNPSPTKSGDLPLIEPRLEMCEAYREFLQECIDAGEEGAIFTVPDKIGEDVDGAIRRLQDHARGINLPEGWVPCSAWWMLSGEGRLLGEIHVRHRLTPGLKAFGGQIGYIVRPSERRKGYATRMLALALDKARSLGLRRVLVTCDPGNDASSRVIAKNGGKLEPGVMSVKPPHQRVLRYWIEL
ncbi:MAG TPA: GNAT family N-acetyltransferase [Chthoniobacteraceae bacterium]|nr:GNAT family N-acetyltransferase [Chthoniobacteraceae bacterium]